MTSYDPKYLKKLQEKELKSIEEHNKERFRILKTVGTGIQCPHCGEELIETNPGIILTSYPAQKDVHCPTCKYNNTVLA